jgi:hypothetical protein
MLLLKSILKLIDLWLILKVEMDIASYKEFLIRIKVYRSFL